MSKQINNGYTDTAIPGVTELKLNRGLVNFGADFRKKVVQPDSLVITNLTSPMDRPETFRFARQDVNDIYSGTGIAPGYVAPSTRGLNLLVQMTETIQITDSSQPDYEIHLPLSVHLVVKTAQSEFITPELVQTAVGRLVSALYDTGSTSTTRLGALMRGSLAPKDL